MKKAQKGREEGAPALQRAGGRCEPAAERSG